MLAFYYQLWWPDRILIKRDATMTFLPIKQYMIERLRGGELPEWFPYDALGRSFLGAAITGVFHPSTLLYFVLPAADALRVSALLACLLAAGGAFWLGRHLGFSAAGALLAGAAFACSGYVVSMTENIQYLYGACLIPLFVLALDKALANGAGWTVGLAVLWASVLLNGDIQTGYYLGFVALLWAIMRTPRPLTQILGTLSLTALLAALLAGIQLGPALSVYWHGNVRHSPFFQEYALQWSTHPLRLLTMLAWPVSTEADLGDVMDVFFGGPDMSPWAESLYLGVPVLGLALLGAGRRRDLRVLAVLGGLANKTLVAALIGRGVPAVGLSGIDGGMLRAEREDEELGLVGRVTMVDSSLIEDLVEAGRVPVIAPAALGPAGEILNVNGDSAAGAIAASVGARLLAFVTDVPGVRGKDGRILARLDRERSVALLGEGTIDGGMIPKVEACLLAVASGADAAILPGDERDAVERVLGGERLGTTFAAEAA